MDVQGGENNTDDSGGIVNGARSNTNGSASAPAPCSVTVKAEVGNKKWLYLAGHQAEVFTCSWNPVSKQLASGSADGVCRLWSFIDLQKQHWDEVDSQLSLSSSVLVHTVYPGERYKDITIASWSPDGKWLATGCYDGVVRIWDGMGSAKLVLEEHQGPVFAVEWNKSGTHLLTAGHDCRVIVWNAHTGAKVKITRMHALPVMDLDWKDDDTFATCSADKTVAIGSLTGSDGRAFLGHQSDVNVVRWSPDGNYLASCSDDSTAKVWTVKDGLLHDLTGHSKEVYSMRWVPFHSSHAHALAPTATKPMLLCTASFDGTAKIWNGPQGTLLHTLSRHMQPLYSIAPSPNGESIAIGALGGYVTVWRTADGQLLKEFRGTGDTYDVSWSADGSLLSSCFSSGIIKVVDPTM
jgi:transducin (beta)-like 1